MSSETLPAISSDASALEVENLGKCYHIYNTPRDRLKQLAARFTKHNYYREFWALRNINFQVRRGQTVGIVGPNGSGKSTLLQLIARILTPTAGKLRVHGRVAALLELGAGFNPEFTGRENVYMNAAILGFSKDEVDERYQAITDFAAIGEFIDRPVKTYSSGMFVRLAFSVAVNVEPEILIVDEALAVGDIKFQARCFHKFEEFQNSGKTILFVSHSTEHIVRHCSHAILLNRGELVAQGEPREISNLYKDLIFGDASLPAKSASADADRAEQAEQTGQTAAVRRENSEKLLAPFLDPATPPAFEKRTGYNNLEYRWGDRSVHILDYLLRTPGGYDVNHAESGDEIELLVKVRFQKDIERPIFGLIVKTPDGVTLFGTNSREWDGARSYHSCKAGEILIIRFTFQALLNSGDYLLSLGVAAEINGELVPLDRRYDAIALHVRSLGRSHGMVTLPNKFDILSPGPPAL